MENRDIARVFADMARLLQILEGNPFRIRSFERAAQIIEDLPDSVAELHASDPRKLKEVPGIGQGTVDRIGEILNTGTCKDLEKLREQIPATLLELLKIRDLGPRKVFRFWKELGVTSLADLEEALTDGRVEGLEGMGKKSAGKLREAVAAYRRRTGRFLLDRAQAAGDSILQYLEQLGLAERTALAGSLRRRRETIGDLDVLATSSKPAELIEGFLQHPEIDEVVAHGPTKVSVRLGDGFACDLRVVEDDSFGAALQYFTGSKAHNVQLRTRAKRMGYKISEYGIFETESEKQVASREEEEIYRLVGLPLIAAELREDRGEIEAAEKGELPELITLEDLRGDLHMHTTASDGKNTLAEMAAAARQRGYEYIAITDHSPALAMARGLDADALRRQIEEIREFNDSDPGITVLAGIEVDILAGGELDLENDVLSELDVVIAAVHSRLEMGREEMTTRICRALENPHVNILAHPCCRKLLIRDPSEMDFEQVVETARRNRVCLELNAAPRRLDLSDVHCRQARQQGVLISLNTDAHRTTAFEEARFGVETARRAWLTAADVINTYPLGKLRKVLTKSENVFP